MSETHQEPRRALTAHEEIYWLLNDNMPIHPVLAAHVHGPTEIGAWPGALAQLQKRHPLLSVSIEEPAGSRRRFEQQSGIAVPLRIVPLADGLRWEAELERELALPFVAGQAPLLRAVLLHRPERFILILAASHSVADGVSLSYLVRDLLQAMAGEALDLLPFPRSEEDLLGLAPVPYKDVEPKQGSAEESAYAGKAPQVKSLLLSQDLTQAVRSSARTNGATVHGALSAAFALAMRRQAPEFDSKPVRFISPVNVRPMLGVEDECGMYFTSPQHSFGPESPRSFWDIARTARQAVAEGSTREAVLAAAEAMRGMVAGGLTRAGAAAMLEGPFAEEVLLTNLGPIPYAPVFGPLRLESLWPGVLAGLPDTQTVGAASTNDTMSLLLTSYRPILRLLEAAEEILAVECAGNY